MRSTRMLAVVTGALVLASACSGDGGDLPGTPPSENTAPVADFTMPPCTIDQACNFASISTDDAVVTAWSWDFNGDGAEEANTANASFTYETAGDFAVSLKVSDAQGLSQTKTSTITIAPGEPVDPGNTPPTAGFTHTCDAVSCNFISTSVDAAPGSIATYAWTFGDDTGADVANPSHGYTVTVPTDFTVTLTVTDNDGATGVASQTISVVPATPPPPPNTPPTAGFTHVCDATANCSFTSTSTDLAPGTIATHAWDFGDGAAGDGATPSHRYSVVNPTDFTVTLTVTDNEGASDVETRTITVTPPLAPQGCTLVSSTRVECRLDIAERSIIMLRLLASSCDLQGQRVSIPPPSGDQVFQHVCTRAVGDSTKIYGGPGDTAFIYEAGSQVTLRFVQGTPPRASDPVPGAPAGQVTGSFPNWTISFDDGDDQGAPGEPDFLDVVVSAEARPAP